MTRTARSLKIFDIPLDDGGKPGRLYDQQQQLRQRKIWLRELFQGPRGLKIAQVTPKDLGAGHPDRRGAPPWWKTGWKSEDEAREFLKKNPDIHKELFPEVEI